MNEDTILLEVMLELAEEENIDLRSEIEYQQALIHYLEYQNRKLSENNNELHREFVNLISLDKRLN
jgi:hypothetical protein